MWKLIAFVIVTALLVYISRASLRQPNSHGFYRFFAWESILLLFLLNVDQWFIDPFSWHQLISWVLLFASLVPLFFGVRSLRRRGGADRRASRRPRLADLRKDHRAGHWRHLCLHPSPALQFVVAAGLGHLLQSAEPARRSAGSGHHHIPDRHRQSRRAGMHPFLWRRISNLYAKDETIYSVFVFRERVRT